MEMVEWFPTAVFFLHNRCVGLNYVCVVYAFLERSARPPRRPTTRGPRRARGGHGSLDVAVGPRSVSSERSALYLIERRQAGIFFEDISSRARAAVDVFREAASAEGQHGPGPC